MRPSAACVRGRRVEQGLVELGPVGADAGDLGLQLDASLGAAGEPLLDRLEFQLAGALFLALLLGVAGGLLRFGGRGDVWAEAAPADRHAQSSTGQGRSACARRISRERRVMRDDRDVRP
jgi:hypothetical protein